MNLRRNIVTLFIILIYTYGGYNRLLFLLSGNTKLALVFLHSVDNRVIVI